jgi:phosphoheptose isomerase
MENLVTKVALKRSLEETNSQQKQERTKEKGMMSITWSGKDEDNCPNLTDDRESAFVSKNEQRRITENERDASLLFLLCCGHC